MSAHEPDPTVDALVEALVKHAPPLTAQAQRLIAGAFSPLLAEKAAKPLEQLADEADESERSAA